MTGHMPQQQPHRKRNHIVILISSICIALMVISSTVAGIAIVYSAQQLQYSTQQLHTQLEVRQEQYLAIEQEQSVLARAQYYLSEDRPDTCISVLKETSGDWFPEWFQRLATDCNNKVAGKWMQEAETYAANGELAKAIKTLLKISGGPFRSDAQKMIDAWSEDIYTLASKQYNQLEDNLLAAAGMLQEIPPESRLYNQAQQTIKVWRAEQSDNESYLASADAALNMGDTCGARGSLGAVSSHPAWSERRAQAEVRIQQQEQAFNAVLQQVADLVDSGANETARQTIDQLPDTCHWFWEKQRIQGVLQAEIPSPQPQRQFPWWMLLGVPVLLSRPWRSAVLAFSRFLTDHH